MSTGEHMPVPSHVEPFGKGGPIQEVSMLRSGVPQGERLQGAGWRSDLDEDYYDAETGFPRSRRDWLDFSYSFFAGRERPQGHLQW